MEFSPKLQIYNAPEAESAPIFVAREEQAELLRNTGYSRARAIGLPIIYTPSSGLPRNPGSLLIVPTHTLVGDRFEDRRPFERYADEIRAIAASFTQVVVCVHPNCEKNGLWIKEFTERGFHVVFGAQTNDANALSRMRALFDQFETITTNGWGSHVAYALTFGAKVAIYGTAPEPQAANLSKDLTWAADADSLKKFISPNTRAQEREFLKRFYVSPAAAVAATDLGRWLTGENNKISPEEMRAVLGSLLDPAPVPLQFASPAITNASFPSPSKRILFVTHECSRTGAPMYLLHFLRWLRRNTSQEFEVLTGKPGPLQAEFAKIATVNLHSAFTQNPALLKNFSVIYANSACCGSVLVELPAHQLPVITHVHELELAYEFIGARTLANLLQSSTHIVVCAHAVAERFCQTFRHDPATISVHHEMIDVEEVALKAAAGDPAELRRQYSIPSDALVVAACGTVDLRKGADLFLQVAARLLAEETSRPVHFLWIGSRSARDVWAVLSRDLQKMKNGSAIHFTGETAHPHPLLALADVFCLTSREDPFPLAMLEAAALGKPIVAFTGAGGAPELCSLGAGVTVPYLNVEAMAKACLAFLRDPELRNRTAARAAHVVRGTFDVSVRAPALRDHLDKLLAHSSTINPPTLKSVADIFAQWDLSRAPQPVYIKAHLTRAKNRRQAQILLQTGKRQEAAQLLIRTVSADLATEEPVIVVESLLEISEDLAPLDAKQSAYLLNEANRIATNTGLRVNTYRSQKK